MCSGLPNSDQTVHLIVYKQPATLLSCWKQRQRTCIIRNVSLLYGSWSSCEKLKYSIFTANSVVVQTRNGALFNCIAKWMRHIRSGHLLLSFTYCISLFTEQPLAHFWVNAARGHCWRGFHQPLLKLLVFYTRQNFHWHPRLCYKQACWK